jgi:GAF domain-containing protein
MSSEIPRVLRRALGLVRFARDAVSASSCSIFLYNDDDRALHGLISDWDWTRTSFSTELSSWPSVEASLASGELRRIDAVDARAAEAGWFEDRGIVSTLCVPLRTGDRALGVVFFDFARIDTPIGKAGTALLVDVGRRCARAFARTPAFVPPPDARWFH